jgi:phosphatidate cytidylyltransferase
MALNTKTFAIRTASALVFAVLLIGSVYWSYSSFSIFFFLVAMLGLNEFYKITKKLDARPYAIPGMLFGVLTYLRFVNFSDVDPIYFLILQKILNSLLIIMPFAILAVALFSKREGSIKNAFYTIGGVLYVVLPFGLLNQTAFLNTGFYDTSHYEPQLVLGIIFLIWSNDTFAYIGGSLFGKNKMIERVSPGKTWEGTITGVILTLALSFIFEYIYILDDLPWSVLGISIPVVAAIGDLVESKLKREAGIKDSGNILPGHGGILDRFDSLIFVSPFVYAIFVWVK